MKLAAASVSTIRRERPMKPRMHKEKNQSFYTVMLYIVLTW
jgi:hypothetical protein